MNSSPIIYYCNRKQKAIRILKSIFKIEIIETSIHQNGKGVWIIGLGGACISIKLIRFCWNTRGNRVRMRVKTKDATNKKIGYMSKIRW